MTQHMEELEKQFSTLRGELEQLKDGDIKIKELKEENKRKDQEIECLTEELQLAKEAEKEAKEVTSKVAEVKKYISEL